MDKVFFDSVYWLFMTPSIAQGLIGGATMIVLLISFFYVIRKWGDI